MVAVTRDVCDAYHLTSETDLDDTDCTQRSEGKHFEAVPSIGNSFPLACLFRGTASS